jgi:hypothetical protein
MQTPALHWELIQAEARGVTGDRRLSTVSPGGSFALLRPPPEVDPTKTIAFARGEVGARYGFLTIGAIAFDVLTPLWLHFPFRQPNTWICSAIAAESLRFGGWYCRWPDIYAVTPSQLYRELVRSGAKPVDVVDAQVGDVGFSHDKGWIAEAIRVGERMTHELRTAPVDNRWNHAFLLADYVASGRIRGNLL